MGNVDYLNYLFVTKMLSNILNLSSDVFLYCFILLYRQLRTMEL
jgi:hypothetical protein